MKLLHVDSSILSENSVSRRLTADVVGAINATTAGVEMVYRDLATHPVGHLSAAHLAGDESPVEDLAVRQDIATGRQQLDEFLAADVIVVGAPMYNFGIPSQLKAWIDRLAVAGKTFRYAETGVEGLAGGKKVVIVSSRGGYYGADTPMAALDHQETYLQGIFRFFGIEDIRFVRAEGLAMGEESRARALQAADAGIGMVLSND